MADIIRYTTPVFRLSFPHLFVAAKANEKAEPKFSCSAIWTPTEFTEKDKALWAKLVGAMNAEALSRFGKKLNELPANIKRGIRDGAEKPDLGGYGEGTKFATLSSKMEPGVVSNRKGDDGKFERLHPDLGNGDEVYAGMYARATVSIYSYDQGGGKGIGLGLFNLQKIRDGEQLASRVDAADDFDDDLESEIESPAENTDDLLG